LTGKSNPIIIQTRKAPAAMLGRNIVIFYPQLPRKLAQEWFKKNHAKKE